MGNVITVHDQILGESRVVLIVFVVSSDAHATGRDDAEPSSQCEAMRAASVVVVRTRSISMENVNIKLQVLNIACAF